MESKETMLETVNNNRKDERGVTTVEYAVMLVLVAIAVMIFGGGINSSVTRVFSQIASGLGA
jgi:Flp pilus assembly pilin Flp